MTSQLADLLSTYQDGLLEDVIPFWLTHGIDHEYGGVITSLDQDGCIVDTDKSVWQQGRFAWMLGEMFNHPLCANAPDRELWLETAINIANFIEQHCFDPLDGRMWFHVSREGRPIRKRRYAFSESFAALAFGELALATQDGRYAELAVKCVQQFVRHNRAGILSNPKFTATRPAKSIGFPMILINTAQQLRDSIALDYANEWIDESIAEIRDDFLQPEIQAVMESVSANGEMTNHFDGRTLNPGHAIEGAWFIMNEGRIRGDQELVEMGLQMLDWMWVRGWDDQFGGILYFVSVDDRPIQEYWQEMKFWWPHNEAIIATLLAYQLSGEAKYFDWHQRIHNWTYEHFPDRNGQEWFGYLGRDGSLSNTLKGNHWKGPFHIPRMMLACWDILNQMIEKRHQTKEMT